MAFDIVIIYVEGGLVADNSGMSDSTQFTNSRNSLICSTLVTIIEYEIRLQSTSKNLRENDFIYQNTIRMKRT